MRINVRAQTVNAVAIVLALGSPALASAGQHEEHLTPALPGPCEQAAQQTAQGLDVLNTRLEAARQTNSPSQMRAAIDDLQAALGSMKAQLSGCTASTTATGTMPGTQHGAPSAAAALRSDSAPARSSAVTPSFRVDIMLKTQPTPLKIGANQFEVTVNDADGRTITDADVSVLLVMPAMPAMKMPEVRNEVKLTSAGAGKYVGDGQVMMTGQWNVTVAVKQNGKEIARKKMMLTSQ